MPSGLYTPPFFPNGTFYYTFPDTLTGYYFGQTYRFDDYGSLLSSVLPTPDNCENLGKPFERHCYTPSTKTFTQDDLSGSSTIYKIVQDERNTAFNKFVSIGARFILPAGSTSITNDEFGPHLLLDTGGFTLDERISIFTFVKNDGNIYLRIAMDFLDDIVYESSSLGPKSTTALDFYAEIVVDDPDILFYIDGQLIYTELNRIPGSFDWDNALWQCTALYRNMNSNNGVRPLIRDAYAVFHAGLPNASAGVIPTSSILLPESTAKPSYIRMLRGGRGKSQAEAFHELMKRKVR